MDLTCFLAEEINHGFEGSLFMAPNSKVCTGVSTSISELLNPELKAVYLHWCQISKKLEEGGGVDLIMVKGTSGIMRRLISRRRHIHGVYQPSWFSLAPFHGRRELVGKAWILSQIWVAETCKNLQIQKCSPVFPSSTMWAGNTYCMYVNKYMFHLQTLRRKMESVLSILSLLFSHK